MSPTVDRFTGLLPELATDDSFMAIMAARFGAA